MCVQTINGIGRNISFDSWEGEDVLSTTVVFGPLWCEIKIEKADTMNFLGNCNYKYSILSELYCDSDSRLEIASGYCYTIDDCKEISIKILQDYLNGIDYQSLKYYFDNVCKDIVNFGNEL